MADIETQIIDTTEQIGKMVDSIVLRHTLLDGWYPPAIYIDIEGVNLCREGSISILTLLMDIPISRVYLIDVHSLGSQAFNTTGIKEKTLKDILQDENIPKVFFDVRNDSDALFTHFGVALEGVEDVQLMESATRTTTRSRKYVGGLAKCVEECPVVNSKDLASWTLAKEKGKRLFKAERGGSYEAFNQRPIPDDIISYCVGDVLYLPKLREKFWWNRPDRWQYLVKDESNKRVTASQKAEYQPHCPDRALAPWSKDQNRTLDEWNYVL